MDQLLQPRSPPQAAQSSVRSPKSPVVQFTALQKITEEADETDAQLGRREDTPIPSRKLKTTSNLESITKKSIFDDESEDSPIRNADGRRSSEKLQAKAPIQAEELMYYSKQDVDALLNQISSLQHKLEILTTSHQQTLEDLEVQQYHSAELTEKLQQQEKYFQDRIHSNMTLLSQKAKEQEHNIQSIKVNMQNMTKSYKDKSDELENKKRKLMAANKESKEMRNQLGELREKLEEAERVGKERMQAIADIKEQMRMLREEYEEKRGQSERDIREAKEEVEMKKHEIAQLKSEVEILKDVKKRQEQIDEENKTLVNENTTLYSQNKAIMDENKMLKRYLDSIREQNLDYAELHNEKLDLPEQLKYDETKVQTSEVQMFDEHVQLNSSARQRVQWSNRGDQTFMEADAIPPQQNLLSPSEFYNPVPQRTFSKFTQPSLQLHSSARAQRPTISSSLYPVSTAKYIGPIKYNQSVTQAPKPAVTATYSRGNRKTIQNSIAEKYMFN